MAHCYDTNIGKKGEVGETLNRSAGIKDAGYENLTVVCPSCNCECIFNRASDIGTFEPIAGREVQCTSNLCREPYWIYSDSVNERHEMLVYECYQLLERKQYMYCILNSAMAYEMFFSLFLRVNLLYKPYAPDAYSGLAGSLDKVNELSATLHHKIERLTFPSMRNLFLSEVTNTTPVTDLLSAEKRILSLCPRKNTPDIKIEELSDGILVQLLKALKSTDIHNVRNAVVHKQGHRPTKEEATKYFEESRSILFPLTHHLDLHDDLNWYIGRG